jgi:ABC-type nickel/cobalt efflux system permease component RcnA
VTALIETVGAVGVGSSAVLGGKKLLIWIILGIMWAACILGWVCIWNLWRLANQYRCKPNKSQRKHANHNRKPDQPSLKSVSLVTQGNEQCGKACNNAHEPNIGTGTLVNLGVDRPQNLTPVFGRCTYFCIKTLINNLLIFWRKIAHVRLPPNGQKLSHADERDTDNTGGVR